jgi:CheY-like chemotaxis protein
MVLKLPARSQPPELERIPIIAATAMAMRGDRERCLAEVNDYVSKPFNLVEPDQAH